MSTNESHNASIALHRDAPLPLISICIPVYNGENTITQTIQSVLSQRCDNIEIVVQDNASTDNTWNILTELAQKHHHVSLQKNAKNVGMAPNWNLAINRARGEYIMLLSADDLLGPDFIITCLELFQKRSMDVVTTNHFLLKKGVPNKRKILIRAGEYRNFSGRVLLQNPFSINFSLFKRDAIVRLKREGNLFRESFFTCDYDLWIRVALSGVRVHYIELPLGTYRVHEFNLSRQVIRMNRQAALVVLANKKGLRKSCPYAYRFTLIRFMVRFMMLFIKYRVFSGRTVSVLWNELIA
jgi:glycosyltransferase involved in cell wall biosynthesis